MEQSPSREANTHLVKKFPFYGIRKFIIVFTMANSHKTHVFNNDYVTAQYGSVLQALALNIIITHTT